MVEISACAKAYFFREIHTGINEVLRHVTSGAMYKNIASWVRDSNDYYYKIKF